MKLQVLAVLAVVAAASPAQQPAQLPTLSTQSLTIAAGVPLHIRTSRTVRLRIGVPVEGVLTEPIYVVDRLVLPKGAIAHGVVIAYAPVPGKERAQALLNGDVTPLHQPVVDFTSLHIPGVPTRFNFSSHVLMRDTQLVRFVAASQRPSLKERVRKIVDDRIQSTRDELFSPGKKDRALRLFYSQLPYHPQRIWAGTQFIADLDGPASIALPAQSPVLLSASTSLDGITVMARLTETLDSRNARKNDEVNAIVTKPVLDANDKLVLAEGAELHGIVTQSRAARSFGRNGQLRFAFRGVEVPGQQLQQAYGTVKAAEGVAGQNITVDDEGNVKANPDKNRFIAPLLLAATALGGHDNDDDRRGFGGGGNTGKMTVASNDSASSRAFWPSRSIARPWRQALVRTALANRSTSAFSLAETRSRSPKTPKSPCNWPSVSRIAGKDNPISTVAACLCRGSNRGQSCYAKGRWKARRPRASMSISTSTCPSRSCELLQAKKRRRAMAANPKKPVPNSAREPGSGVALMF